MRNICFIHIPKCGGTSIRASMNKDWLGVLKRNQVNLDHPASAIAAEKMERDILSYREDLLNYFLASDTNQYVMGHFKCTKDTRLRYQHNWQFITLIRDPVKRWYSHYYFDRFREKNLKYKKTDLELATYLDSVEGQQNARLYTRHFSGFVNGRDEITMEHAETAIDNILGFDVFGILENLSAFNDSYHQSTGVKLKIPYKNKNPKKGYKKQEISQELVDRVEDLCKYDKRIYAGIKAAIDQPGKPNPTRQQETLKT